jgi:hypothetical protein
VVLVTYDGAIKPASAEYLLDASAYTQQRATQALYVTPPSERAAFVGYLSQR